MRVLVFADEGGLADELATRGLSVSVEARRVEGVDAIVTVMPRPELELVEDLEPIEWKERFRQSVEEPFFVVQAWLRDVLARGGTGRWVAVTSALGTQPLPSGGCVGAAAAALHTLVRIAAVEYGPRGVRANAVAVGWREDALPQVVSEKRAVEDTPAGRLARVTDVAGAVSWLLSPDAEHVNGEVLRVDGGYTITRSRHVAPSEALEGHLLEADWLEQ